MTSSGSRPRILFVDDEQAVLNSMRRALRHEKYELHFTTDPRRAISIIEQKQIQIVVTDQSMPALSGLELLALVAELHPRVHRIVLTGHVDESAAIRAVDAGHVHRFLTKPWNNSALRAALAAAARELGDSTTTASRGSTSATAALALALGDQEEHGAPSVVRSVDSSRRERAPRREPHCLRPRTRQGNEPMTSPVPPPTSCSPGAPRVALVTSDAAPEKELLAIAKAGMQPDRVIAVDEDGAAIARACVAVVDLGAYLDPLGVLGRLWCIHPELPVIALCDPADRDVCDAAQRAGVAAALMRPYDADELVFALRRLGQQEGAYLHHFVRDLTQALSRIGATIALATTPGDFLQATLEQLVELFHAERGSVLLLEDPDDDGSALRVAAQVGLADYASQQVPRAGTVAGRVLEAGVPQLLLRSLDRNPGFSGLSSSSVVSAAICVPIRAGSQLDGAERVLGVLNVSRCEEGAILTPRDLDVCVLVANEIGEGLRRIHMQRREDRLREQMRAVEKLAFAGEVAAGIAHEVANPIGYTKANIELLQESLDELAPLLRAVEAVGTGARERLTADDVTPELAATLSEVPELLEECMQGMVRAAEIVSRTMQLVRLEGQGEVEPVPVDLGRILESTLRLLRSRVHPARLEVDIPPDVWAIGNEGHVAQVLVNLVTNAADACAERGRDDPDHRPVIRLRIERGDREHKLIVEDNGAGMTPEQQRRIFDPLFTTKPRGAGTGLGMSVVRRIVNAYGGGIDVESQPDQGTRFTVRLLAHSSASSGGAPPGAREAAA